METEDLFHISPYGLRSGPKRDMLTEKLARLTAFHSGACLPYRNILSALRFDARTARRSEDFPFLPVQLFKDFDLKSVADSEVIKTLTSSGTTSQRVSRIFLDRKTSLYQTKTLVNIMQDFIGRKRLPMIIADSRDVIKDRKTYSARGAGILGLSNFGRDHFYLLDKHMCIDFKGLEEFLTRNRAGDILIFGFTFMLWQYVYKKLLDAGRPCDLSRAVLIHSGGWKKLLEEAVDRDTFNKSFQEVCGISRIYNFYGMVEQVGSIFMECEFGNLHAPNFADIVIRDPLTWAAASIGEEGIIETLSILPHSYPGHVLLTEDLGTLLGEDDCQCSRNGKYFSVKGRVPMAEIRGCSDTYAYGSDADDL